MGKKAVYLYLDCNMNLDFKTIMTIKVLLEPNCSTCKATLTTIQQAAKNYAGQEKIIVEEINDVQKILEYNVWAMPAVIVNEEIKSMGKRLTLKQAEEIIRSALK
ncbi:MAG: thioredoxin family protein [Sphingobacteriia bacterium]|nr:thioredoxin family protein [Paludibacteraceae bacterium]NCA78927.1 thioredoxin family protein [Sphingobacteriia bacterium]